VAGDSPQARKTRGVLIAGLGCPKGTLERSLGPNGHSPPRSGGSEDGKVFWAKKGENAAATPSSGLVGGFCANCAAIVAGCLRSTRLGAGCHTGAPKLGFQESWVISQGEKGRGILKHPSGVAMSEPASPVPIKPDKTVEPQKNSLGGDNLLAVVGGGLYFGPGPRAMGPLGRLGGVDISLAPCSPGSAVLEGRLPGWAMFLHVFWSAGYWEVGDLFRRLDAFMGSKLANLEAGWWRFRLVPARARGVDPGRGIRTNMGHKAQIRLVVRAIQQPDRPSTPEQRR